MANSKEMAYADVGEGEKYICELGSGSYGRVIKIYKNYCYIARKIVKIRNKVTDNLFIARNLYLNPKGSIY